MFELMGSIIYDVVMAQYYHNSLYYSMTQCTILVVFNDNDEQWYDCCKKINFVGMIISK